LDYNGNNTNIQATNDLNVSSENFFMPTNIES
jgi:hypothetical protein